jgi:acyl carrier protein
MPTVAAVDELRDIYQNVLRVEDVDVDDELPDLGVESMLVIQIAMAVQERLDVELPLEIYLRARTVRAVAEAVGQARKETPR